MAKEQRSVIEDLLEEMKAIVESGMSVPFSDKVWVDKSSLMDLIDEIKANLPKAMQDANHLLSERERIISDAEEKSRERMQAIEAERDAMVNESEITRLAYIQAEEIVNSAKTVSKDIKTGAKEYADDILFQLGEQMKRMGDFTIGATEKIMTEYQENVKNFNEALEQKMAIIQNNRKELNINRISDDE